MSKMRSSLIATVKDEAANIDLMMNSISIQTKAPDEIIIVDAGSCDGTLDKLHKWSDTLNNLTLLSHPGCSRSEGRNIAIERSTGDVIAVTDFGCTLKSNWFEEITAPILKYDYDTTAGYYVNEDQNIFSMINSFFSHPALFEIDPNSFLPSTRSIAFLKSTWGKAGKFNPKYIMGEDTLFSLILRNNGSKIFFNPNAVVVWNAEKSLFRMFRKIFNYSKWDGKGNLNNKFYYKMILKLFFAAILLIISFVNNIALFVFLSIVILFLIKTFLTARKKRLGILPSIAAAFLKPIYNFAQAFGFIFGRITEIK